MISEHQFVFICGLHRSGTSILHALLRDQKSISGFINTGVPEDEGQHLQSVFSPAKVFGGPGRFGFHSEAAMTEAHPLVTDQNREKLFHQWSQHWDLSRPILVEKSPPNIIRTRFLQAMFPNAYFIVITRHPIAVAYATMKWSKTSLSQLFEHWLVVHRILERDKPHLSNLCMLSYEELIAQPDLTLKRIGSFLNIPLQPIKGLEDRNISYLQRWSAPGVRHELRRYLLLSQFEKKFLHFGYSLKDVNKQP